MLGRAAADAADERQGKPVETQKEAEEQSHGMKERLWSIMVRPHTLWVRSCQECATDQGARAQIEMSRPGTTVLPTAGEKEKKLLAVKYKVFKECIDIQRGWRKEVSEALA